jgi:uncharacterized protein YceH (UPF0502 family)
MHLFSGDAPAADISTQNVARAPSPAEVSTTDRLSELENEVQALRKEVSEIKQEFTAFREQFK